MTEYKKVNDNKFKIPLYPFIEYLESLSNREMRGELATFRRGLQHPPGRNIEMYPYIIPWLGNAKGKWEKQIYYLVASLYAYHPSSMKYMNLGEALRKVYQNRGESNSIEQRFVALLKSDPEDLPFHMRQVISLIKTDNIPLDWNELFYDLRRWPYENKYPSQEKWANSFWKPPKNENKNE